MELTSSFTVASSARCIFSSGSRALYSPVRFLDSSTLVCTAPQLCFWTTNGISGRSSPIIASGAKISPPPRGTPCVFPFIYKDQLYSSCQRANLVPGFLQEFGQNITSTLLGGLVNGTGFCSITANLSADKSWGACECLGPPMSKSDSGPRPMTGAWLFGVAFNGFFVRRMNAGLQRLLLVIFPFDCICAQSITFSCVFSRGDAKFNTQLCVLLRPGVGKRLSNDWF